MSAQSWWMQVFMCKNSLEEVAYEFVLNFPCLARLTWMVCEMRGKWLYIHILQYSNNSDLATECTEKLIVDILIKFSIQCLRSTRNVLTFLTVYANYKSVISPKEDTLCMDMGVRVLLMYSLFWNLWLFNLHEWSYIDTFSFNLVL